MIWMEVRVDDCFDWFVGHCAELLENEVSKLSTQCGVYHNQTIRSLQQDGVSQTVTHCNIHVLCHLEEKRQRIEEVDM